MISEENTGALNEVPFSLDDTANDFVEETLSAMTLEQKVAQLLCVYLRSDDMAEWTAWLDERGIEPGGVLLLGRSREAARTDLATLQEWSRVPLLVAANLESGTVNFLEGTEAFANPMQVAATRDPQAAERLAIHCARAANDVGVNWAFAPVIDIAFNPRNPITNTRTFGSDPDLVEVLGETYVRVLEQRGIATSPKHFPGDGHDDRDQHLVTTNNNLGEDEWWETYGRVWQRAIAAGARTVMVGHIRQRALSRSVLPNIRDEDVLPASLAPELITGILRQQLGFKGLIVTDNSAMAGFTTALPREDALPRAIEAGNDMLLGNVDLETDFHILLKAVKDGKLSQGRIDEAVRRILATKASLHLHLGESRTDREQPHPTEEAGWRHDIAEHSMTLVKNRNQLIPVRPRRGLKILLYVLGDQAAFYDPTPPLSAHFLQGLRSRGADVHVRRVPGNEASVADADKLHERFDLCIYYSDLRFVGNSNVLRVAWTPAQGPDAPRHTASLPTVLVSIADPYVIQDLPMVQAAINGYTPTTATVDAALAVLFGEQEPLGLSPVDASAGHWDALI